MYIVAIDYVISRNIGVRSTNNTSDESKVHINRIM